MDEPYRQLCKSHMRHVHCHAERSEASDQQTRCCAQGDKVIGGCTINEGALRCKKSFCTVG